MDLLILRSVACWQINKLVHRIQFYKNFDHVNVSGKLGCGNRNVGVGPGEIRTAETLRKLDWRPRTL